MKKFLPLKNFFGIYYSLIIFLKNVITAGILNYTIRDFIKKN